METAKVFNNGGSQAVRLPKDCRFDVDSVIAKRVGNIVMLIPKEDAMAETVRGLSMFSEDFMNEEPEELPYEKRETI